MSLFGSGLTWRKAEISNALTTIQLKIDFFKDLLDNSFLLIINFTHTTIKTILFLAYSLLFITTILKGLQ
jgi:hypothetical protein